MTQTPKINTHDVTFRYSRKGAKVLDDVSIEIRDGSKSAILGANGAGKSTLFSILNALRKPEDGKAFYDGKPISYRHRGIIRMRSEVSILFQNPNDMMFKPYVGQDVAFGPENMKLSKQEVDERVDEALFTVGMSDYKDSPIMKLSYGQRKRVTLAGVLAMRPKVLILDEPTAGLDPQMAYEVMEIAEQLNVNGVTVIMSSHDTDLTYTWADDIHVIQHGRLVYSGAPDPFYADIKAVTDSGLMRPSVFSINRSMASAGAFSEEPYPRTQTEMAAKISSADVTYGTLHIIATPADADITARIAESGTEGMPSGIYGISARMASERCRYAADYMFDAAENCISECLSGKDSVILCDPVMVPSVEKAAAAIVSFGNSAVKTKKSE